MSRFPFVVARGVPDPFLHPVGSKTKLFYPETDPKYDLVAIILALARLDDVLDKGFTVQEVLALDPAVVQDKFGGKLVLGVRPEKQQEPLLKKYDLEDDVYVISNEAAMPAERGRYLLRAAGKAAGFTSEAHPLCFPATTTCTNTRDSLQNRSPFTIFVERAPI